MKATTAVRVINFFAGLILVVAIVVVAMMGYAFFDFTAVSQVATATRDLSTELRVSSNDLTRFVRSYVVTGNGTYRELFQQVRGIRGGELPVPVDPARVWWDLVVCCGAPRGTTPPRSLASRMQDAGFKDAELELLSDSLVESEALVYLEDIAMAARRRFDDESDRTFEALLVSPVNRERWFRLHSAAADPQNPRHEDYLMSAVQSVHSTNYHARKGAIMRPIDEFITKSYDRVHERLRSLSMRAHILIGLQVLVLLMIISVQGLFTIKTSRDAAASSLLATVLPERVVGHVSVGQFQSLRRHAVSEHRRRGDGLPWVLRKASSGGGSHFPTLFTEFVPSAWVTFVDVVSFTPTCRTATARQVISMLNELFSLLDVEANYAGVEKIKTIGDAMMAVVLHHTGADGAVEDVPGGTVEATEDVAEGGMRTLAFLFRAFQVAEGVARPKAVRLPDGSVSSLLVLRAGLHAGPVAAGIVGFERPLYDVFGDTVNIAARLEAASQPSAVLMLRDQLHLLGSHRPHLDVRASDEPVDLKGVGPVDAILVLSDDREVYMTPATAVVANMVSRGRQESVDRTQLAPSAPYSVLHLAAMQETLDDEA